ncbi:hypothetical protein LOK49_LG11G02213 [Camellia lanceoleosa]|uniref:Uncharacterized protein n=1 Tax=Camellia lanceoleosa TaxID=1840588 RepID=A0ACC0G3W4_9ERIC|nr:hypothetical protein LOK49_LG11G02213 [Camellia lanceoleosa]
MWPFTIPFCLVLFLFSPHRTGSPIVNALSIDLINTTCKQCSDKSTTFNFDFCLTSLQPIPISHVTNLQGLALIAMELALENTTDTMSSIEKMLKSGEFDPFALRCLKDCVELYGEGVPMLANSIGAFLAEQYDAAKLLLSAVMEVASTCEDGFVEEEGEASPLTKENSDLFRLVDIAVCIIDSITFDSKVLLN